MNGSQGSPVLSNEGREPFAFEENDMERNDNAEMKKQVQKYGRNQNGLSCFDFIVADEGIYGYELVYFPKDGVVLVSNLRKGVEGCSYCNAQ